MRANERRCHQEEARCTFQPQINPASEQLLHKAILLPKLLLNHSKLGLLLHEWLKGLHMHYLVGQVL